MSSEQAVENVIKMMEQIANMNKYDIDFVDVFCETGKQNICITLIKLIRRM